MLEALGHLGEHDLHDAVAGAEVGAERDGAHQVVHIADGAFAEMVKQQDGDVGIAGDGADLVGDGGDQRVVVAVIESGAVVEGVEDQQRGNERLELSDEAIGVGEDHGGVAAGAAFCWKMTRCPLGRTRAWMPRSTVL